MLPEAPPDHSTISRTRRLIDLETHQAAFTWMQQRLADAGLVKGKTVGIDATTHDVAAVAIGAPGQRQQPMSGQHNHERDRRDAIPWSRRRSQHSIGDDPNGRGASTRANGSSVALKAQRDDFMSLKQVSAFSIGELLRAGVPPVHPRGGIARGRSVPAGVLRRQSDRAHCQ